MKDLKDGLSEVTELSDRHDPKLMKIYETSEWYSVKYIASLALGIENELDVYIKGLEEDLNAETGCFMKDADECKAVPYYTKRRKAVKDAAELFKRTGSLAIRELLEKFYLTNSDEIARTETGKALGHCSARIRVDNLIFRLLNGR